MTASIPIMENMIKKVLSFWFKDCSEKFVDPKLVQFWFAGGKEADDLIRDSFLKEVEMISENLQDSRDKLIQSDNLQGSLSAIILLDQFRRNIYRNSPAAFSHDHIALSISKSLVASGDYLKLDPIHKLFVYMPFEHSEAIQDQIESLKLFDELNKETKDLSIAPLFSSFYNYAVDHHKTISRFGRFPSRNAALKRQSTQEEIEFMQPSIKA